MQTIKCSQVVSCDIKYIVPRTYILAFIFTYRSFPYLEVQATPTTCIPADRQLLISIVHGLHILFN